jgi:hypothetical protein
LTKINYKESSSEKRMESLAGINKKMLPKVHNLLLDVKKNLKDLKK